MIKFKLFNINCLQVYLFFAVVISPIEFLNEPNNIKVDPNLFYRSKDIPPILQSWKNDAVCFSESPKCSM
jgi:hypothetical protein